MKFIFLLVLAFAAGMLAPVQAGMNAKIGKALNDPFYAALISFAVGTAGLLAYALTGRMDFATIRSVSGVHWSLWLAGLLGAFYVTATIVLAPRLGTALTFGLVVAGQLVMAVVMDHFGLFGMPVQPVNWFRLAGIALIVGGTMLIRWF
ncbi:DMT family transporter [Desulfobacter sp.]|uniref:DMT family transporter n=1 Tax=Desulfobacter sp. TaxID=2294 RepID=UPI003D0C6953